MEAIVTALLEHGLLGMAVIVLGVVIRTLYKRNQEMVEEKEQLHLTYQKKLDELSERYVTKIEAWAEKNREMAAGSNAILDALIHRKGD